MQKIKIDHKNKTVILPKGLILNNQLIYEYFSKLPLEEREEAFFKALYIGTLALVEDRLAEFLAKTKSELGAQLEYLKIIFEIKKEIFYKTTVKGRMVEQQVLEALNNYFVDKGWKDYAILVGETEGKFKDNKTGDILCFVDGEGDYKVIVEVKATKSLTLGDLGKRKLTKSTNDIWGQLIEARANREAKMSIIAIEKNLLNSNLVKELDIVHFIPNIGFVALIDTQRGDYMGIIIAYKIARSFILGDFPYFEDRKLLTKIAEKFIKEANDLLKIRGMIEDNIKNNKRILNKIEESLKDIEITRDYLKKLLEKRELTTDELYNFLKGEPSTLKR